MGYEPREGVDYMVNLYAAAGAPLGATPEELKQLINQRIKDYHPDRLQGHAPEFQSKGERMAVILNRARHILLNDERRAEYDKILNAWDGPLSEDGTPAITMARYMQIEMASKTPEEIEEFFNTQAKQIEDMTGFSPNRLTFLESMIAKAEGEPDEALRAEYEDALLQRDRVLAIQEAKRSQLLGLPDIEQNRYVAALGYSEQINERIEQTRIVRKNQLRAEALGGVSTRLALLSGESAEPPQGSVIPADTIIELPHYFEDQAQRIREIATTREEISKKRLANFKPTYPEAELQTEFKKNLAIGIGNSLWLGANINPKELNADIGDLPANIQELLQTGDFKAAIEQGYNVLTFKPLDQLDMQDLLLAAIEKYINKYNLVAKED